MKKYAGMLALMTVSPLVLADVFPPQMVLDKVVFQVSAKQWVTTQTALLNVNINVTLNNADLVKARSEIMDSLNKIAAGDWHLLEFDRSQDSSGLEKLYVQAQARVDQATLTDIYQNAKNVTTPGTKYEVSGVEFKPSLEETQAVRAKIREQLYKQINDEIAQMNKAYPTQNYTVNNLVFVEGGDGIVQPQPRAYQAKEMNVMAVGSVPAPSLTVSNELTLTALVEAASIRTETKGKSVPATPKPTAENLNSAKVTSKPVEKMIKPAQVAVNSLHAAAKLDTHTVILSPVKAASNLIGATSNRIPEH
ncbi:conserved exported protein of unknown function [Legionella fallonii LLAP-10]|uniref:Uncharacterized protein n=1 Tax=Legionella fallonii LLAP-10 TaxID=1212491 RepID=A0A098G6V5_9GAMM|nr:conserved exported protein of unknown function [Legionella fallonii LLAP-10]